jgi:CUB/sushi domain-containing protein
VYPLSHEYVAILLKVRSVGSTRPLSGKDRSMATYSCNTGYTIEGENIRNCQSDGDWSGIIPTCNPVICPALTIPENGNLDTSGLIFRSTAIYSCNVGYAINGNSTRLCQSDRNWSGLPPICEPVICPVLSIPDGGRIVTTGQIFNSVAIFSCNDCPSD